jgi:hypothetical protein
MIRGAFKRAVLQPEDKGTPLSDLIAQEIEKNVFAALRAISGFIPREMLVGAMEGDELTENLQSIMNEAPTLTHEQTNSTH